MAVPGTATSTVLTVLAFRVALRPETSLTGLSVGFERNDLNDGICFIVLAVTESDVADTRRFYIVLPCLADRVEPPEDFLDSSPS